MVFLISHSKSTIKLAPRYGKPIEVYTKCAFHENSYSAFVLISFVAPHLLYILVRLLLFILIFWLLVARAPEVALLILCQILFLMLVCLHHISLFSYIGSHNVPSLYQKFYHIQVGGREAMLEEMMALEQNEAWNLVYLPRGKGGWLLLDIYCEIESKWLFGLLKGLIGGKGYFTNFFGVDYREHSVQ